MPRITSSLNTTGMAGNRSRRWLFAGAFAGIVWLVGSSAILAQESGSTDRSSDRNAKKQAGTVLPDKNAGDVDAKTKALYDKLAKYLSGTKWSGEFTMTGKKETRTEHYEILSAEKSDVGDYWNLVARIKYGGNDATFPLPPIEIKFAGGTPVITVDQVFFPGFGKFDARVLIRKGQYAGTWAHIGEGGGVGGHMFGTIEKMDPKELEKKTSAVESQSKTKE